MSSISVETMIDDLYSGIETNNFINEFSFEDFNTGYEHGRKMATIEFANILLQSQEGIIDGIKSVVSKIYDSIKSALGFFRDKIVQFFNYIFHRNKTAKPDITPEKVTTVSDKLAASGEDKVVISEVPVEVEYASQEETINTVIEVAQAIIKINDDTIDENKVPTVNSAKLEKINSFFNKIADMKESTIAAGKKTMMTIGNFLKLPIDKIKKRLTPDPAVLEQMKKRYLKAISDITILINRAQDNANNALKSVDNIDTKIAEKQKHVAARLSKIVAFLHNRLSAVVHQISVGASLAKHFIIENIMDAKDYIVKHGSEFIFIKTIPSVISDYNMIKKEIGNYVSSLIHDFTMGI